MISHTESCDTSLFIVVLAVLWAWLVGCAPTTSPDLDRHAIVERHAIHLNHIDTLGALTLGNGRFAMTMDVTGLQTWPELYQHGIPLGTQSEWGWHRFPASRDYSLTETLESLSSHGRSVPYARQWPYGTSEAEAANYLRQNPHRIHLVQVGWLLIDEDGSYHRFSPSDLTDIDQTLDMWQGKLVSQFNLDGIPVEVISMVAQDHDQLNIRVKSNLVEQGRLGVELRFPYPTDQFYDYGTRYETKDGDRLTLTDTSERAFRIIRDLDDTQYNLQFVSEQTLGVVRKTKEGFVIPLTAGADSWTWQLALDRGKAEVRDNFIQMDEKVAAAYAQFWQNGGMIDFGRVQDPRAQELERRMILSRYLTHVNCGGATPPQETGLTYNSWYGKPHMEMAWWHGVHFALWGQPEQLEAQMEWYFRAEAVAREIAQRQGFAGVRWQKMTDPEGGETVSSVGSYLIWQQPHPIYFAELLYRADTSLEVLERYQHLVMETAAFMADFAYQNPETGYFDLPGVIPAQERFGPDTTDNPTFELAYWRWGLEVAQTWRERLGWSRQAAWDTVLAQLAPLPILDGVYLPTQTSPDGYTNHRYITDHPAVLGAFGFLPETADLDRSVMQRTFDKIWSEWEWEDTWGWDFPLAAMTAVRLGDPERSVDALLMPISTNTYLVNGHNYQTPRLRLYLPGNGGLLTALALMAAGADDMQPGSGFPADWEIHWEGLQPMP